jgi:hypothetical protein
MTEQQTICAPPLGNSDSVTQREADESDTTEENHIEDRTSKWSIKHAAEWTLDVREIVAPTHMQLYHGIKKICYEITFWHRMFPCLYYIEHIQQNLGAEQLFDVVFDYRSQGSVVRYMFNENIRAVELGKQTKYHVYKTSDPSVLAVAMETNSERFLKRLSMTNAALTLGHLEYSGSDVIYHFEDHPLPLSKIS